MEEYRPSTNMTRRRRTHWTDVAKEFFAALLFAVFGAALCPLLPFRSDDPKTTALVVVSACVSVGVVFALVAYAKSNRRDVRHVIDVLKDLAAHGGPEADLLVEPYDVSKGQYFRELTRLLEQADKDAVIRVMTHQSRPEGDWDAPPAYKDAQKDYFKALSDIAAKGGTYHRILCFDELEHNTPLPAELLRDHMREHALEMLRVSERKSNVVLRKAKALLAADVLLIGEKIAAITVEAPGPGKHVYTAGALIVHNPPNARIISRLLLLWRQVKKESDSVAASELEGSHTDAPVTPSSPL